MFQEYQANIFEKFREWDYKQIAIRCARVRYSFKETISFIDL
jgi:hypothetical protein